MCLFQEDGSKAKPASSYIQHGGVHLRDEPKSSLSHRLLGFEADGLGFQRVRGSKPPFVPRTYEALLFPLRFEEVQLGPCL